MTSQKQPAAYAEIEIAEWLAYGPSKNPYPGVLEGMRRVRDGHNPAPDDPRWRPFRPVFSDDVAMQIELARVRGVRVLLLRIGGIGGQTGGELAVSDALARFAAGGGTVITYLMPGVVASALPLVALAGSIRLMHPDAEIIVHSVAECERRHEWNERALSIIGARTRTSLEVLRQTFSATHNAEGLLQVATVSLDVAIEHGWAHMPCDESVARSFAAQLAEQLDARAGAASPKLSPPEDAPHPKASPLASPLASATVGAQALAALAVTAEKIHADAIRTSNFTSTGSGESEVASNGAKMQIGGTALITAPGYLKIGTMKHWGHAQVVAKGLIAVPSGGTGPYTVLGARNISSALRLQPGVADGPTWAIRVTLARPVGPHATIAVAVESVGVAHVNVWPVRGGGGTYMQEFWIFTYSTSWSDPAGFTSPATFHVTVADAEVF